MEHSLAEAEPPKQRVQHILKSVSAEHGIERATRPPDMFSGQNDVVQLAGGGKFSPYRKKRLAITAIERDLAPTPPFWLATAIRIIEPVSVERPRR